MPVYNERHTLETIVQRVLAAPIDMQIELVIVDDGSKDGSADLIDRIAAREPRVRAFHQDRNRGKGAAIARAIQEATGDYAIVQDADLEYDPSDYPAVLRPLTEGLADVVYGSRFTSQERRVHLFWHQVANDALTTISNMLNDLNLTDMETGYKAFRMSLLKIIPVESRRFGIEPEITAKIARLQARVYEVPIKYHGRSIWEGKKITWKDGASALWVILKYGLLDGEFTTHAGLRSLQTLARAREFTRWVHEAIRPHLGQRILQVGAGIGTLSKLLVSAERLVLTESDPIYLDQLRHRFGHLPNIRIERLDLADGAGFDALAGERVDTLLSVEGLERVEDDRALLSAMHKVLTPGGRAIILAPQGPWLYGSIDRRLGRVRRYSRKELEGKLTEAGFTVREIVPINGFSTPGWFLMGRVLGREHLPRAAAYGFDLTLPLVKPLDRALPWPALSLLAIAER